ncbi:hypothetical protein [Aliarcobacter butzleri]|uniref:hypothetical protein n=1 Tax=Aliarcobacter butzleri TaxID=28197 RepID=UPI00125EA1E8|nr:hypothetical protein [Aliarcobacter butzleri]
MKNEKIEKFTEQQKEIIESCFDSVYTDVKRSLLLVELVKTSLVIESSDEVNKNTCPYDTKAALEIVVELLKPIKSFILEASCDGSIILNENFLKELKSEVIK